MTTKIWYRNGWKNVKISETPKDVRLLDSFLIYNDTAKCFVRAQGGWYKITKEGSLFYVTRTLTDMTLEEWYKVAINDKFTPNIKQ